MVEIVLIILLLATLSLLVLPFGCYLWLKARKYSQYGGNLGSPVFGNLFRCMTWHCSITTYARFFDLMERTVEKYGLVSSFWFSNSVGLAVADPFLAEKLIYEPTLHARPSQIYTVFGNYMRNALPMPTGKEWRLRRKELNNYLRKSCLESYHSAFLKVGNKAVKILSQKTEQFDCTPDFMMLAIELVAKTHYGLEITLTDHALYKDIHYASIILAATLVNPFIRTVVYIFGEALYPFRHERKLVYTLYEGVLQKLNESIADEVSENENLNLASTIAFRNAARKTLGRELLVELTEIVYTGSHTFGIALATALLHLATNPHVQEKVLQEQKDILGDSEREPTPEDVEKMDYLGRVFKEVSRFVGPPFSIKEAGEDIEIDGNFIPKGTVIVLCPRNMRFDTRYWSHPEAFDPDRHLPDNTAEVPKCANASFGYGIRVCPGYAYATYAFKVIISSVVRNFVLHSTMKFEEIKYSAAMMMDTNAGCNISVKKRNVK